MSLGFDIPTLHMLLWVERTANNTVRIQQNEFCERLQVTKFTVNRLLRRLEDEGRVRSLTKSSGARVKTYEVYDPEGWTPSFR